MASTVTPPLLLLSPAIIAPPMVSTVILTSTSQFALQSHPLNKLPDPYHLGLVTIYYGLKEAGFDNVSIFQPHPHQIPDIEENGGAIVDEFKKMGAGEKGAVIGISSTTDEYFRFPPLSRLFRRAFPGALIVAGGVHFVREEIEGYRDSVELALAQGLADAVQVGHTQAFIDFITRYKGDLESADGPGFYRVEPSSKRIIGGGEGKFPKLSRLPYYFSKNGQRVSLILRDACRNGCDFCTAYVNRGALYSWRTVRKNLERIFGKIHPRWTSLRDSNPMEPQNFGYYRRVFETMDGVSPSLKSIYLNPALLVDNDYRSQLVRFFEKHHVYSFFMGRDAVTGEVAQIIGSRKGGSTKDQFQLDRERDALAAFIKEMKSVRLSRPPYLVLSYIITPFETKETLRALMDELMLFESMVGPNFIISVGLFPLMPYPGTRLRRRIASLIDPEEFDFHRTVDGTVLPWKRGIGRGTQLMAEMDKIKNRGLGMDILRFSDTVKRIWDK
jgi:hypothetical protein